jgi:hypothetical protein
MECSLPVFPVSSLSLNRDLPSENRKWTTNQWRGTKKIEMDLKSSISLTAKDISEIILAYMQGNVCIHAKLPF